MQYVVIGSRCLVGLVFAVAAVSKLRTRAAFGEFVESIRSLHLLGDRWVRPVAAMVVAGEALSAVLMMTPRPLAVGGFALGAALLMVFAVTIMNRRRQGVRARCRCFGSGRAVLGGVHVARNVALAAAAVLGAIGLATGAQQSLHAGGFAVAAATGIVLALFAITMDDVIELFRVRVSATVPNPRRASR